MTFLKKTRLKLNAWRWQRWSVGVAGMLFVYSALGFWLLPRLLLEQIPKLGQSELARKATLGAVRFNPFTLRLELRDVRLAEADGAPLLAIAELDARLEWRSLAQRAWRLAEVRICAPRMDLTIGADGRFNLAELMATLDRRPHSDDPAPPRLVIARFALEHGTVRLQDRRVGYDDAITPIDIALSNVSTLVNENGSYRLDAEGEHGARLHWRSLTSLNPIRASGELVLEKVALPDYAAYLAKYTRAGVHGGTLSATLPYHLSYLDGKLDAGLTGARLALDALALAPASGQTPFATLDRFDVSGINADLTRRSVSIDAVHLGGGTLALKRDARRELDLAAMLAAPDAANAGARATAGSASAKPPAASPSNWTLHVKQVRLDQIAVNALDESVSPAVKLGANKLQLRFRLDAEQAAGRFQLKLDGAAFSLADLTLQTGAQTPFKLAHVGFEDGQLDLAARQVRLGRLYADGAQARISRERDGQLSILRALPKFGASAAPAAAPQGAAANAWNVALDKVELKRFNAEFDDQASGVKAHVEDFNMALDDVSSDLTHPLKFKLGLSLREGGRLAASGVAVPSRSALDAQLTLSDLALAPLNPLLRQYVTLTIAGGALNARGRITTATGTQKGPRLRYAGAFDVADLALDEADGDRFASWKRVSANKVSASIGPDLLDIAELHVLEPNAKLMIENDHSLNAERLLVQAVAEPPAKSAATTPPLPAKAAASAFPVRIGRVRFQNAKLDFTDLSLRPQFSAKIYELNGSITDLSSQRDARSEVTLDGRVDQFGLARVRGQLNPFATSENTDLNVVFKKVDMVSASPYAMKFAGYQIADGKISLDLQYKVRHNTLEGSNQIVLDNLTLGERSDSPDALKLPLELALAILKDQDGRIELGVPVSGQLDDPQFSYGGLVWKALGNVLSKIVSAPFRALGTLFGVGGAQLEAIEFDPGSAVLSPPEQEKLRQVAQILARRPQLKLSVPAHYSEQADGAELRARALTRDVASRAGLQLVAAEPIGPEQLRQRGVRAALRALFTERFGAAALDAEKSAAERAAATSSVPTAAPGGSDAPRTAVPMLQRIGRLIEGEPQVADASQFYRSLQQRLIERQVLAPDALPQLGARRAAAVLAALNVAGVAPASAGAAPAEAVAAAFGKPVPLKLGMTAK
jgi:hypothetical protein